MEYTTFERRRAAAWKRTCAQLPEEARDAAPYLLNGITPTAQEHLFCLPPRWARHNLLDAVRGPALDLFVELGIPWHAGIDGGPSNHLLDSQVQCVNALFPMVTDPDRIKAAFGQALDIGEVLQIEPGRHLTFEYIGPEDVLGEAPDGRRTRGARCTSVDAAFLHRAPEGAVELVLVEWKYTESYAARRPEPVRDEIRRGRYQSHLLSTDGPVRGDLVSFDDLLGEPFYQLMRQQLLAWALEQEHAEGADRVRVVHVAPTDNLAYRASVHTAELRALGTGVYDVWAQLLRHADRFITLDSAVFAAPEISSAEYVARYAEPAICALADLLRRLDVIAGQSDESTAGDIVDALDLDADVVLHGTGIEVVLGRSGVHLEYPFWLVEVYDAEDHLMSENAEYN